MSASDRIPGMVPGRLGRNVGIAVLYLFSVLLIIAVLPFVAAAAVGTNFRNSADRLTALPGIAAGGGLKSGGMAFVYGLVIIGVMGTVTGSDSPSDGGMGGDTVAPAASTVVGDPVGQGKAAESKPTGTSTLTTAPTASPTLTVSASSSPTGTSAPTTSTTASPTPTATASQTPTATASPSPTQAARGPQEGTKWTVTITRVIDGDTVEARFPNGEIDTLRLLGVDTPETTYSRVSPEEFGGIPDTTAGRDHLFNWGEKATGFTSDTIGGKTVRVEVDPETDRRGSFGRLLVYVYVDGENFNERLLVDGYARLYESSFSGRSEFEAAEAQAQNNDVGLWDFEAPTASPTATKTQGDGGDLAVVAIHADAAGNDHENENDEYIVFENTGTEPLDLSGWRVEDKADHTYYFPSGFTLDPGARVTLYTGSGTNSNTELYWGSNSAIWNNDGDTIYVYDEEGRKVIERTYS